MPADAKGAVHICQMKRNENLERLKKTVFACLLLLFFVKKGRYAGGGYSITATLDQLSLKDGKKVIHYEPGNLFAWLIAAISCTVSDDLLR